METKNAHIVSVLFTRYHSTFSNFVYWIRGRGYTHASIALDDRNECFYSFNFRGFCKEDVEKIKKRSTKSVCFYIEVSDECYKKMKERLEHFQQNKEQYEYCRIGIFLCVLHIAFKFKNQYFCSQFVAEMLEMVDTLSLSKKAELYFPNDLSLALDRQMPVKNISYLMNYPE